MYPKPPNEALSFNAWMLPLQCLTGRMLLPAQWHRSSGTMCSPSPEWPDDSLNLPRQKHTTVREMHRQGAILQLGIHPVLTASSRRLPSPSLLAVMFAATLLCQVLLASAAFAIPTSKERFAQRAARRASGFAHQSQPKQFVSSGPTIEGPAGNVSHVDYSSNWAGAVLVASTATYKSVTGTFTVPTPKEPSGGSGEHSASAWVGIDGDTCGNAILQTGVDFTVSGSSVSYDAWYEWYPDYAYDFSGISFSAGDTVTVTVTATSKTGGTATITNKTKGKTVSHTFSGQPSLCEYNAEWIVEDFEEGSSLVPFANFGTVAFTGASAGTVSGSSVGPSGATLIDIKQNNKVLTSVSTSGSSVTVKYTG